jgi:hypothetical protein
MNFLSEVEILHQTSIKKCRIVFSILKWIFAINFSKHLFNLLLQFKNRVAESFFALRRIYMSLTAVSFKTEVLYGFL